MSRLFDALQRSEADRAGVDVSALPSGTELLQLAELHATSERRGTGQVEPPRTATLAHDVSGSSTAVEPSPDEKGSRLFDQFQTLHVSASPEQRLVCLTDNESLAAEKFRYLGVRLQQLRRERPLKKVLITSTIPQEGKSTVSANLACALARQTQQKVLLVEGDIRRPSLLQMFGLSKIPGICEWLRGESDLTKNIHYLDSPGLWFLPAGSTPKNPLELLESDRLATMMERLTAWFDWIVIDSPPIMPLADTSVWVRWADGVLVVARQGVTEKRQLERGLEALEPKKLIGAIMNGSKRPARSDYYYYTAPRP